MGLLDVLNGMQNHRVGNVHRVPVVGAAACLQ